MNQFLMQLAIAALGQFAGGGPGGSPMGLPMAPMAPIAPMAPLPTSIMGTPQSSTPSLQLTSLATATCLLRGGMIRRDQAQQMMQNLGQSWGWSPDWGQRIRLEQVDQAIRFSGGCTALLERMQGGDGANNPVLPARYRSPEISGGSFSEREGFGLAPYR